MTEYAASHSFEFLSSIDRTMIRPAWGDSAIVIDSATVLEKHQLIGSLIMAVRCPYIPDGSEFCYNRDAFIAVSRGGSIVAT
jgi:hypothetical protein